MFDNSRLKLSPITEDAKLGEEPRDDSLLLDPTEDEEEEDVEKD
jgi:hypothetical protein